MTPESKDWLERIDRISCFESLIEQEEKRMFDYKIEESVLRITALQNAIERENEIILGKGDDRSLMSYTILTPNRHNPMEKITLLSSDFMAIHIITPVLKRILPENRNTLFQIKEATIDHMPEEIDCALLFFKHPASNQFESEQLSTTEFNLYASPDYLEQQGAPQTLADMAHHTIIRPERSDVYTKFTGIQYKPIFLSPRCFKVDTMNQLFSMAEQGMGIIAFNDLAVKLKKSNLEKLKKLENTYECPYIFNVHQKSKALPIIETLKKHIKAILA